MDPAHRTLDQLIADRAPHSEIWTFLGNAWADFFAKLGAQEYEVAKVAVASLEATISNTKLSCDFLGRAVQMICARPEVSAPCGYRPAPSAPAAPAVPALVVIAHDPVAMGRSGHVQCRKCLAIARTSVSRKCLLKPGAICSPSPMLAQLAEAVERMGWRDKEEGERCRLEGVAAEVDGHKVFVAGPFFYCRRCGARAAVGSAKLDALSSGCPGNPPNAARRKARENLADGRDPVCPPFQGILTR